MSETKTESTLEMIGMDIYRAERLAQEHGFDSCTMTIIGPQGIAYGKWLDAYMGLFMPDKADGFVMTRNLADMGFRCLALFGPDGEQIKGTP
ncbi:MAG TPA: hypothetical protein VLV48_01520 [Thermoanaerobaculia bacterium]|nr:hypothetical protein [Thermoanaerobaculia bacterium]